MGEPRELTAYSLKRYTPGIQARRRKALYRENLPIRQEHLGYRIASHCLVKRCDDCPENCGSATDRAPDSFIQQHEEITRSRELGGQIRRIAKVSRFGDVIRF